jgi:1-deoxy-D-xylulose-5-phosphate reductoisomerase
MKKNVIILGSTGSIGKKTFEIFKINKKDFKILLLSTNTNYKKVISQANELNVKNIIITDYKKFILTKKKFKKKKLNIYNSFSDLNKIIKNKKIYYSMVSIVGLNGLNPCLKLIKYSKNIGIVNKESLLCGWSLIKKKLKQFKTNFIPIDSEHFSISELIKNKKISSIERVYLTASGGPFLNFSDTQLKKVTIKDALKHPNWKMGKKISIDSATMMNKVFEVIEAKNIFDIPYSKISILIHPDSYVHALIKFIDGQIKILAHESDMRIPIQNSIYMSDNKGLFSNKIDLQKLNNLRLKNISFRRFPTIKILDLLPKKNSLYETALVTINDFFVEKYLQKKINFNLLIASIIRFSKNKDFLDYRKLTPKNVNDIYKTRDYVSFKLSKLRI